MSATRTIHSDAIPVAPSLPDQEKTVVEAPAHQVNRRVFFLSLQAVINALIIGLVAKLLVALISLITNISFYGKFSFEESSPAGNHLGLWVVVVPVIGALIVGVMARFGSSAIRGHGIPEAMEQVLTNESKIKPIITFLKPISAAISIGTGGPFGAEGPIISTGGAFGSVTGQIMRISPNERKIMLAAGACAGMSAIFGTPLAAVLLAIELLLFEFSPRSIIPVALSCAAGAAMHFALFNTAPAFAMPAIPEPTSMAMLTYVFIGAGLGVLAALVSRSVYFIEDLFEHLPLHWMWWPAIGAVAVGVVGYFAPRTLGVGYSNISDLLTGALPLFLLGTLSLLKFLSWSISLGSGTSGGTLAPLLTIGGAFGALIGMGVLFVFPQSNINLPTCALIGMAAMFAGASRALLTSIVFALETTMQPHGLLPLLGACTASYFVSFFLMRGSIMTEKIERRGIFTPHSYEPDALQRINVADVYAADTNVFSVNNTVKEAREWLKANAGAEGQAMTFIVVNDDDSLAGVLNRKDIFSKAAADDAMVTVLIKGKAPYVQEQRPLSIAVDLMDRYEIDVLPVTDPTNKVVGGISHREIFSAYSRYRNDAELSTRSISLKRQGIKIILKGRQVLGKP